MAAKSSIHVPKFGNWDTDDVPYTICFDNARELRAAGVTFDPNDPDTYPPPPAPAIPPDRLRRPREEPSRDRRSSGSEKLSSERSGSDYALLKKEAKQSGRRKIGNGVEGISRFPPTAAGHGANPNPNPRERRNEGETRAKYGRWDDARNPKSGDEYTAIPNKARMEKQIAASNSQAVPPLTTNQTKQHPIAQTTHGSTSFVSKVCCCLCPK